MIMSLPLASLTVAVSTHQGLFDKVHEAMSLLKKNNNGQLPIPGQQAPTSQQMIQLRWLPVASMFSRSSAPWQRIARCS